MSETNDTALEPEAAPSPPEAPETPPESTPEQKEAEARLERRFASMSARMGRLGRERDELAQRLAQLEGQGNSGGQPPQPIDPQLQAAIDQRAAQMAEQGRTQERVATFHEAGKTAYPDWRQRCDDLQAMGADPQFAALLVEMDGGHKIAAALRDAPEELEHIASLRGERARAIALGQFAARLEAQPTRAVSKAPPPPQPISGRVAPQPGGPNWSADDWANYYSKQDLERRGLINRR